MSLINEALKKAQRQRTDAVPPMAPVAPSTGNSRPLSPRIVKRKAPMPARALMMLLTGGVLVLLTGIVLTVVVLNLDSPSLVASKKASNHQVKSDPVPVASIPPPPTVVLPPIVIPVKPVEVIPTIPPLPAPVVVTPALPVVRPTPPPVAVVQPAVIPVPVSPVSPAITVAPAKPVANPAVTTFLDTLRITGVRVSGDDSKAILNDRVVRIRDYVDRTLRLRLIHVTQSEMVFTDDNGFEYTKSF